ncbi:MAG: 2-oxo-4-hydroxy-4-carboxy-5-ureidoimidazoline decarboxylase [Solirubrobacteraceae bacterium]
MSAALLFTRHLQVMAAAPGRPDGASTEPAAATSPGHPAIPTDRAAFVERFGGVVEHSAWVAEAAWEAGPFRDVAALHAAVDTALFAGTPEQQLAVLLAHPELATRIKVEPADLTAESASEQAGAGLDRLAEDRRLALAAALAEYRERFGFPFIACVRDHGGATLGQLVASRLPAERDAELQVALREVSRIARHRLDDLVPTHP